MGSLSESLRNFPLERANRVVAIEEDIKCFVALHRYEELRARQNRHATVGPPRIRDWARHAIRTGEVYTREQGFRVMLNQLIALMRLGGLDYTERLGELQATGSRLTISLSDSSSRTAGTAGGSRDPQTPERSRGTPVQVFHTPGHSPAHSGAAPGRPWSQQNSPVPGFAEFGDSIKEGLKEGLCAFAEKVSTSNQANLDLMERLAAREERGRSPGRDGNQTVALAPLSLQTKKLEVPPMPDSDKDWDTQMMKFDSVVAQFKTAGKTMKPMEQLLMHA